eukprot:6211916-Pleurochrysis_carterae.AAC.4
MILIRGAETTTTTFVQTNGLLTSILHNEPHHSCAMSGHDNLKRTFPANMKVNLSTATVDRILNALSRAFLFVTRRQLP